MTNRFRITTWMAFADFFAAIAVISICLYAVYQGTPSVVTDKERIKQLEHQLAQRENKIAELEKKLKVWEDMFGIEPPQTVGDWFKILQGPSGKAILQAAGRGFPQCEDDNALISVTLVNGVVSIKVLTESPRLREWSEGRRAMPSRGAVLTEWSAVREYEAAIRDFYGAQPRACRFDYNLNPPGTYKDWHDARNEFEKVFYPGQIAEVP